MGSGHLCSSNQNRNGRYQVQIHEILNQISAYYTDKISRFGDNYRGVDWNSHESQIIRFEQLCKIIKIKDKNFSINDLGCGYGALLDYLKEKYSKFSYLGVDICQEMIMFGKQRHTTHDNAKFIISAEPESVADYGLASGIFNVRLGRTNAEWFDFIISNLEILDRTSRMGFSFNCLTNYADQERMQEHLYYADPLKLFDFCKRRFSQQVALLHDYGLYEFTILVRKNI